MASVKIFALDGSLQCGWQEGVPPEIMEPKLKEVGITVISRYKKLSSLMFPSQCGAPTGMANVFEIPSADTTKLRNLPEPKMFMPWLFDVAAIEIYKPDGTLACFPSDGKSPEETAQELKEAGIEVIASRKDDDGIIRPKMCGLPTGKINVHEIRAEDFLKAQALGFSLFSVSPAHTDQLTFSDSGDAWPWKMLGFDGGGGGDGPFPLEVALANLDEPKLISELIGRHCRVIRPGDQIDMMLLRTRVNIILDGNSHISRIGFF